MTDWILVSSIPNGRYLVIDDSKGRVEFLEVFEEVVPGRIKFDEFSFEEVGPDESGEFCGRFIIDGKYTTGMDYWSEDQIIYFVSCLKDGVEVKFDFGLYNKIRTVHYIAGGTRRAFKFLSEGVSFGVKES